MLFVCGGAFEGLYDMIVEKITNGEDERTFIAVTHTDPEGQTHTENTVVLRRHMQLADLFEYGMAPQFISRFKSMAVLNDLDEEQLKRIMLTAPDSPFRMSQNYFASMGIELKLTKDALGLIAYHAARRSRIGARALTEVFARIVDQLEFDPFSTPNLLELEGKPALRLDSNTVRQHL